MKKTDFDLMSLVEYGGCSAKLPAGRLSELLSDLPLLKNANVLVDVETHDDAGVYRLDDSTALIVTTDFFPPVCSDPFTFGQIAAANALSDVYAMGGVPLLTLNLTLFPSATVPLEVLRDILLGGQDKVNEAGAFTMGGHTIEDATPKYGLAVVGTVAPDRLVTNAGARPGDRLVLTKPLGTGAVLAGRRLGLATAESYEAALEQMKLLNRFGGGLMHKYGVQGATDVTGFGLLGHLSKMADASGVSMQVDAAALPLLPGAENLLETGCVPGAAFRNLDFVKGNAFFSSSVPVARKMAALDAQTSGGLLMSVPADRTDALLKELHGSGLHPRATVIGEVQDRKNRSVYLV